MLQHVAADVFILKHESASVRRLGIEIRPSERDSPGPRGSQRELDRRVTQPTSSDCITVMRSSLDLIPNSIKIVATFSGATLLDCGFSLQSDHVTEL